MTIILRNRILCWYEALQRPGRPSLEKSILKTESREDRVPGRQIPDRQIPDKQIPDRQSPGKQSQEGHTLRQWKVNKVRKVTHLDNGTYCTKVG